MLSATGSALHIACQSERKNPHLMPSVADHGTFFGKRVKRVPRYEPGGLDVVFVEELEQPPHTNSPREEACI